MRTAVWVEIVPNYSNYEYSTRASEVKVGKVWKRQPKRTQIPEESIAVQVEIDVPYARFERMPRAVIEVGA